MLRVVHSNRMERLADRLAAILRDDPVSTDPFVPERVVVQSPGLGRWLGLRVAESLGVAAHVLFEAPLRFLYETAYRAVLGEDAVPEDSSFRRDVLVWRLLRTFPEVDGAPGFEPLSRYLAAAGPRDRLHLASRVADALDRLTVWRPDWIATWERGGTVFEDDADERWQRGLWRALVEERPGREPDHRAAVQVRFREALRADPDGASAKLPRRVVLVGGASIPRPAFDDFVLLSEVVDVHVLFLNPCAEDWTEIRDRARTAREALRADADPVDLHLFDGHPLLASWGRHGQAFLEALLDADALHDEAFEDPAEAAPRDGRAPTVLETVQSDVLRLAPTPREEMPGDASPGSIQLHACHSPMREMEVLQDRLLALFEADPALEASDVVVLAPDIDRYAPYVDAVFGAATGNRFLPYVVADRASTRARPLAEAVLALLDLPNARFEVGPILDLLDVPAIRRRFDLDEAAVASVRAWAGETGIRWGIDADRRARDGAPVFEGHAFRDGLDRLMEAYACGEAAGRRAGPAVLEGDDARVAGRLHAFSEELFEAAECIARPSTPSAWAEAAREVLARFVDDGDPDDAHERLAIEAEIGTVARHAREAGYDRATDPAVYREALRARLGETAHGPFLAGGVTFCRTTPLRAVPFPVVALVGMDADAFPRPDPTPEFELIARDRRRGDPSRREDDRYLFLESLLSARTHLIVTWVGRGARDDRAIPPAVPVAELIEHTDVPVTSHPLQPYSPRYGTEDDLFSYRPAPAPREGDDDRDLVVEPLPAPDPPLEEIDLDDLLGFVGHPSRWFVRQRLGIVLREDDPSPEPREPFAPDGLGRYLVQDAVAAALLAGGTEDDARRAARATGLVPVAEPGRQWIDGEIEKARAFVARVLAARGRAAPRTFPVEVRLGDLRLVGAIEVRGSACVAARPATLKAKDRLQAWVRHLALAAATGGATRTVCVASDAAVAFEPLDRDRAAERLDAIVACYRAAHRLPPPLFPEAACTFAEAERNGKDEAAADDAARKALEHERGGEAGDPYVRTLHPGGVAVDDAFREAARRLLAPMLEVERKERA